MNHDHQHPDQPAGTPVPGGQPMDRGSLLNFVAGPGGSTLRRTLIVLTVAVAVFYLLTSHWVHVLDALPYVFVVGMLGMHLFGHGGHGGHGGGGWKS
ncbi:DUF2933 domain-containing protein [Pseudarthrobacter sp. AB1]|uniref:DUF2933 domain-containing protein n=1 Tax=Pseudarthrobacter sp. AB1 TaxID=2138309 RepID=UPI00186B82F1|nr:DUF2933 domain-containing protein [Pseudarthrobacter sp. AB1]MBE4720074.1 hypothetical protein [Pseudarthrobacter sp. AB1]